MGDLRHPQEGEKEVCHQDLHNPQGAGAEREERSQWVISYRAGDEAGDWIWRRGGRVKFAFILLWWAAVRLSYPAV